MSSAGKDLQPGRLWSLWGIMINYHIHGLCLLLRDIREKERYREAAIVLREAQRDGIKLKNVPPVPIAVNNEDKDKIRDILKYALKCADNLDLQAVRDRIDHFNRKLNVGINNNDFLAELRTLRETFESGIKFKHFYLYPTQKAQILLRFGSDWEGIIKAFPDVVTEANCAVDLYALGHNTASVFHSMRVVEHGLRTLAKERRIKLVKKKPVEWANWLDIIKALEDEAKLIGNKTAGAAKDHALEFYNGAIADLNGFKDEYRNLVMHVRAKYDDLQAERALQCVRAFMDRLSKKLDHKHYRIRWGIK